MDRICTLYNGVELYADLRIRCQDCGTKFEKLVRRAADASAMECPSCGQKHLQQELSTFAAHANGAPKSAEMPAVPQRAMQQSRHVRDELKNPELAADRRR